MLVKTFVAYLVLVEIEQACTLVQLLFTKGYVVVVSPPIVIATSAAMVVSTGISYAITIQYFSPFLYEPAGKSINKAPSAKVTL